MNTDSLLIIFARNPELGKVKTRLAKTIGDEKALKVYLQLFQQTISAAAGAEVEKEIWFSGGFPESGFIPAGFSFHEQQGDDLGSKMEFAFRKGFDSGYKKIMIIGTDCPDINSALIEQGMQALDASDFVIGPAEDGGYYLLGMRNFYSFVFHDIAWSTATVLSSTMEKINQNEASVTLLQTLQDVDEESDLDNFPELKKSAEV